MDERRRALVAGLVAGWPMMTDRVATSKGFRVIDRVAGGDDLSRNRSNAEEIEWISVSGDLDSKVVVPVIVGDVPMTAILDTGSATTIIDSGLATRLGVQPLSKARVQGNVNSAVGTWGTGVTVVFGRLAVQLSKVALLDLSTASSPDGEPIGLVLGHDVFDQGVLDFDFSSRRVALRSPASFREELGAEQLSMRRGPQGERYVLVSIEGRSQVPAILDLGSSNPIMISAHYAASQRLLDGKSLSSAAIAGVDGINITTTVSVRSIDAGASRLNDIPCEVFQSWYSSAIPVNLGLPVLNRFRLAIDFSRDRVWIKPTTLASTAPFRRDLAGLGLATKPNRLKVVHVAVGSPAERNGWTVGDEIVAIDGQAIGAGYLKSSLVNWRYAPEGRTLLVTLSTGVERRLTLARYY